MIFRLSAASLLSLAAFAQDGAAIYKHRCAACHDNAVNRAPAASTFKQMSPEAVQNALVSGSMAMMGFGLTTSEIKSVATQITGKAFGAREMPDRAYCGSPAPPLAKPLAGPHWNGWGVDLENHRFQPAAMAGVTAANTPRLKLKWAFAFPNASRAFAQPTIAGGRVFVGSAVRQVYSLEADTGCIQWIFEPDFAVRTAITIGPAGNGWRLYFGDAGTRTRWTRQRESWRGKSNRGVSWRLRDGRAEVARRPPVRAGFVGRRGHRGGSELRMLQVPGQPDRARRRDRKAGLEGVHDSGRSEAGPEELRRHTVWGPSGAGVWSSPTVDVKRPRGVRLDRRFGTRTLRRRTSDAFLAFDLETGKLLWSRQFTTGDAYNIACGGPAPANCPQPAGPDHDFSSSPILVTAGEREASPGRGAEIGNGARGRSRPAGRGVVADESRPGRLARRRAVGVGR